MNAEIKVGVIGDFNPRSDTHRATKNALKHAADSLSTVVTIEWIATEDLERTAAHTILRRFDALWCAPGSPYKSMVGALQGIEFARETSRPFFGS
jgi:CTP synthase (UTP-ammonia lyase)